jgi:uncharacterized protein YbaA (DUF1428 family)
MYINGYVIPVPEGSKDRYRAMSEIYWDHASKNGALEHVEAWEADVPDGKLTDFRRAVDLKEGEKVVFSWVMWPDKAAAKAFEAQDMDAMMSDPRMKALGDDMPFDGKRMIFGGFEPIVEQGRAGGGYVDGFIVPVPNGKREAYRKMAAAAAEVFLELGATRDVEGWGIDVPEGKVTDFHRAVKAEDGETVVFSFLEWPDEETRNEGWKKVMADERMNALGKEAPFDGQRMFWGGFAPIVNEHAAQPRAPEHA